MTLPSLPFIGATAVTRPDWPAALHLAETFRQHHPASELHILALEGPSDNLPLPGNLLITWARDLGLPDFQSAAMQYQPEELLARLKPRFLLRLLENSEAVVFLAPQTHVCGPLDGVLQSLETASILLVPRYLAPFPDTCPVEEVEALMSGQYHAGFMVVRRSSTGLAFLNWLDERCRELAFDEPSQGLCLDQKWLNLAPCLFPETRIERSPGLCVGPWNLHEYQLQLRDHRWWVDPNNPLVLFHRAEPSAFPASNGPTPSLPDFCFLPVADTQFDSASAFAHFSDGAPVSAVARKVFAISPFYNNGEDPFHASSQFARFCRHHHLIGPVQPRLHPAPLPSNDFFAVLLRWGFYAVLRIFGAPLYEMFLKYLRYLSAVRNQHELFFGTTTPAKIGLDPQVYARIQPGDRKLS